MVEIGDRVRLSSARGPQREGSVTRVSGSLLTVRWPSGDETTVVPAPGTLTVLDAEHAGKKGRKKRRERDRATADESDAGKSPKDKKGRKGKKHD